MYFLLWVHPNCFQLSRLTFLIGIVSISLSVLAWTIYDTAIFVHTIWWWTETLTHIRGLLDTTLTNTPPPPEKTIFMLCVFTGLGCVAKSSCSENCFSLLKQTPDKNSPIVVIGLRVLACPIWSNVSLDQIQGLLDTTWNDTYFFYNNLLQYSTNSIKTFNL